MRMMRLIFLVTAMSASASVGFLAVGLSRNSQKPVEAGTPPMQEVLVSTRDLGPGDNLEDALAWANWPVSSIRTGYITRVANPEALMEYQSRKVQVPLFDGDPVRAEHFRRGVAGAMSTLLPAGKRAVAVKISADTSAGGFILPNDFADVIMTKRRDDNKGARRDLSGFQSQQGYTTETILHNVRVLAIDQTTQEDEHGRKVLVGQTATLELSLDQAEIVTVAQQTADRLSLVLRSAADTQDNKNRDADDLVFSRSRNNTIRMVSGGSVTEIGVTQR